MERTIGARVASKRSAGTLIWVPLMTGREPSDSIDMGGLKGERGGFDKGSPHVGAGASTRSAGASSTLNKSSDCIFTLAHLQATVPNTRSDSPTRGPNWGFQVCACFACALFGLCLFLAWYLCLSLFALMLCLVTQHRCRATWRPASYQKWHEPRTALGDTC